MKQDIEGHPDTRPRDTVWCRGCYAKRLSIEAANKHDGLCKTCRRAGSHA